MMPSAKKSLELSWVFLNLKMAVHIHHLHHLTHRILKEIKAMVETRGHKVKVMDLMVAAEMVVQAHLDRAHDKTTTNLVS